MKLNLSFDDSRAPLLHVTLDGKMRDAELDAFLQAAGQWFDAHEGQPFVVLVEIGKAERTTSPQNAKMRDWYMPRRDAFLARCEGLALVIPGRVQRAVVTALLKAKPLIVPHCLVKSRALAEEWCAPRVR